MPIQRVNRSDLQVVDPESVILRGYAGVFNNVFKQISWWETSRYMILPGAFAGALERLEGAPLPVFFSHLSGGLQIAETTKLVEDSTGLYFEAPPFVTTDAVDTLNVIAARLGGRIGASFAFDFGEVIENDDGVKVIHSFSAIHELGPATWGANPLAYAEIVEHTAAAEKEQPEEEPAPASPEELPADDEELPEEEESALSITRSVRPAVAMAFAVATWRETALLRSRRR
jgi:HK97 family phage prohead protease